MSQLHRERSRKVPNSSFGNVVGGLRLRDVDDAAGHAADEDEGARGGAGDKVAGDGGGEEVGAVDVDAPEFLEPVVRVSDGVEVLGEAGGGHQVVDLVVVSGEDRGDGGVDGVGGGDVAVVGSHVGDVGGVWVVLLVLGDEILCAVFGFLLYIFVSVSVSV